MIQKAQVILEFEDGQDGTVEDLLFEIDGLTFEANGVSFKVNADDVPSGKESA